MFGALASSAVGPVKQTRLRTIPRRRSIICPKTAVSSEPTAMPKVEALTTTPIVAGGDL